MLLKKINYKKLFYPIAGFLILALFGVTLYRFTFANNIFDKISCSNQSSYYRKSSLKPSDNIYNSSNVSIATISKENNEVNLHPIDTIPDDGMSTGSFGVDEKPELKYLKDMKSCFPNSTLAFTNKEIGSEALQHCIFKEFDYNTDVYPEYSCEVYKMKEGF